jgi:hypothetical protein
MLARARFLALALLTESWRCFAVFAVTNYEIV